VATVAQRLAVGLLAAAEKDGFGFIGLVGQGSDVRDPVGSVAEGLPGAPSTGAPVVFFAGDHIDGVGSFLGDDGIGHASFLKGFSQTVGCNSLRL
jgi:hypothetical protein